MCVGVCLFDDVVRLTALAVGNGGGGPGVGWELDCGHREPGAVGVGVEGEAALGMSEGMRRRCEGVRRLCGEPLWVAYGALNPWARGLCVGVGM